MKLVSRWFSHHYGTSIKVMKCIPQERKKKEKRKPAKIRLALIKWCKNRRYSCHHFYIVEHKNSSRFARLDRQSDVYLKWIDDANKGLMNWGKVGNHLKNVSMKNVMIIVVILKWNDICYEVMAKVVLGKWPTFSSRCSTRVKSIVLAISSSPILFLLLINLLYENLFSIDLFVFTCFEYDRLIWVRIRTQNTWRGVP